MLLHYVFVVDLYLIPMTLKHLWHTETGSWWVHNLAVMMMMTTTTTRMTTMKMKMKARMLTRKKIKVHNFAPLYSVRTVAWKPWKCLKTFITPLDPKEFWRCFDAFKLNNNLCFMPRIQNNWSVTTGHIRKVRDENIIKTRAHHVDMTPQRFRDLDITLNVVSTAVAAH